MVPVIENEVVSRGWLDHQQFAELVSVAGMSPGPIATNTSIAVGMKTAGIWGAVIAAAGSLIPSFLVIVCISLFFMRSKDSRYMRGAFYGLRAIITALMLYAGIHFGLINGVFSSISIHSIFSFTLFILAFIALFRYRMHPFAVIVLSGMAGVVLYA